MQPYQEEYIANLKEITQLSAHLEYAACSFADYQETIARDRQQIEHRISRNMELLRDGLFPLIDRLFAATPEEITELEEFAGALLRGKDELDGGLFCQIYEALLSRARQDKDRSRIIRCLYWLGIGRHNMSTKMVGLDYADSKSYMSRMRLCFAEAAAYLKYYDEIDDTDTRGYILRSRANIALGQYESASAKIRVARETLQILQDEDYQTMEPELPWDRFIYMTHQQIASSISYSRDNDMTPQDVAAIMESVHIVHQGRILEALDRGETPSMRSAFACRAIEYYCGLMNLTELLGRMEALMDFADGTDFSADGMYMAISLPAFYCNYLREYPEQLPGRETYLEALYRKVVAYTRAFPADKANEQLFYFLRQLSSTYIETPHSISYGEFQLLLLTHFAPDVYVHSKVVGKTAAALCDIIMEEDAAFFDDIDEIHAIKEPAQKRRAVLDLAENCGLFHDVGKINFIRLFTRTARQWFEEEYEITKLHTVVGNARLAANASTRGYAAAALGHHSWYDGSHGYPESYRRLECPYRQMVDVIGLFDWIDNSVCQFWLYGQPKKTFDEAISEAISLEGRRFSPLLTAMLRDTAVCETVRRAYETARRDANRQLYEMNTGEKAKNDTI